MNRGGRLGHGVKTEWRVLPAGDIDVLENFPGPAKVDNHRAFGNEKGNGDTALGWRLEGICFDRWFVCVGSGRGFGWI
jgi:hypothetical protein